MTFLHTQERASKIHYHGAGCTTDTLTVIDKDVRPDGLGSIGIIVELSGGRKLIFRQHINGLGVNLKKKNVYICGLSLFVNFYL
jgi:hypothetical protein